MQFKFFADWLFRYPPLDTGATAAVAAVTSVVAWDAATASVAACNNFGWQADGNVNVNVDADADVDR